MGDEVKDWNARIDRGVKYLEESKRLVKWRQHRDWYDNKYPDNVISVNLLFSLGRALVPQLYFKSPTILVTPLKQGLEKNAQLLEAIDQWLMLHIGLKTQIKLGIVDAFLTNVMVFKFGYHSVGTEFPTNEKTPQVPEQTLMNIADFLGQDMAQDTSDEDEEMRKYSYHDWVKPNAPWCLRVQPEDFIVPYGTRDEASMPWCAFRVIRPLEDIQADPVYSNTKDLKPNVMLGKGLGKAASPNQFKQLEGGDTDYVEFFEIWDKRDGTVRALVPGHQKLIRKDKHNLPIDGLPAEVVRFNSVGWDFWGESDAFQIKNQIIEFNETRTLELRHKRALVLKIFVDKDNITDDQIAKITNGEICVAKVTGPPAQSVMSFTPQMSRDIFNVSEDIRADVKEILGFSRNQVAEFSKSRNTATEAAIVQQAMQLRSDERRDTIADFIASAFQRKIHPMIFEFWTEQRSIKVTGLGGWIKYTSADIKGDYSVIAVPDSVVPLTRMQRKQEAMTAFQAFRNDPRINQQRLYEYTISQMGDSLPRDLLLDEQQYQMQMKQQALMQFLQQGGGKATNGSAPRSGMQKVSK